MDEVKQRLIEAGFVLWESPQAFMEAVRQATEGHETQQPVKRQRRYDYSQGPVYYLGQQIVRAMQDAGYPAKISECYRSAERQIELYYRTPRVTKAGPFESAHQYFCAVDIIHPAKGWEVSEDYWETLASCVRVVAQKFEVELDHGHFWRFRDSAHIQLEDWRHFAALVGRRKPDPEELGMLFEELLPEQYAQRPLT
jgi:hypothetical protein